MTKKIISICLFCLPAFLNAGGQILSRDNSQKSLCLNNLVLNNSFEIFLNNCDPYPWFSNNLPYWWNANQGTVDYFNKCDTTGDWDIPQNYYGYQETEDGNAYCGFFTYYKYPPNPAFSLNCREYPEVKLPNTLIQNKTYCLSFYVSLADSSAWATNNMGVYFSHDSIIQNNFKVLPFTPQINFTNIISDTSKWTEISGDYTATGGEKFLIFGNFYTDDLTAKDSTGLNPTHFNGQKFAYYYIDNISLCLCSDTLVSSNILLIEQEVKISPNPANSLITVDFDAPVTNGVVRFYDVLGKLQKQIGLTANTNQAVINISDLSQGIYFLKVTAGNNTYIQKLLKE